MATKTIRRPHRAPNCLAVWEGGHGWRIKRSEEDGDAATSIKMRRRASIQSTSLVIRENGEIPEHNLKKKRHVSKRLNVK